MVIVTNTTPIKYVDRPRSVGITYGCNQCSTTIILYVRPTEVTHKCKRTRRVAALTERKS